jgi:WD40-like Beta Propeller Repeat
MTIRSGSTARHVRLAPFELVRTSRPLRALLIVAGLVTCGCATLRQPGPPQTALNSEVFLARFHEGGKATYRFAFLTAQRQGVKVGKPVNITKHPGRDQHPAFLPDSSGLAFSSSRGGAPAPYRYDIATKVVAALGTATGGLAPADSSDGLTPAGSKVIGRKARLLIWQPAEDHWINIADARGAGVDDITEIAVSPDGKWIAFTATMTRK